MEKVQQMVEKLAHYVAKGNRAVYPLIEQFLKNKEIINDPHLCSRLTAMKMYCIRNAHKVKKLLSNSLSATNKNSVNKNLDEISTMNTDSNLDTNSDEVNTVNNTININTDTQLGIENIIKCLSKYSLESAMMRIILRDCDMLSIIEEFPCGINDIEKYEVSLLLGEYSRCRRIGTRIMQKSLSYVTAAVLLEIGTEASADKRKDIIKVLIYLLSKSDCNSSLLLAAYRKGISFDQIKKYISEVYKDIEYVLLCKELLLSGEDVFEPIQKICSYKWAGGKKDLFCACALLLILDDWDIYRWVLEKKLEIKNDPVGERAALLLSRSRSLNYRRYQMEISPTVENILQFVSSPDTAEAAGDIIRSLPIEEQNNLIDKAGPVIGAMIEVVVWNKIPLADSDGLKRYMEKDPEFLLGVLLARKDEQSLLLALILGMVLVDEKKDKTFKTQLILTGIYRELMMYERVISAYINLNPQETQLERLTHLWSDLSVILYKENTLLKGNYIKVRDNLIQHINASLLGMVENERYTQIPSLIDMRKTLRESPTYLQIMKKELVDAPTDVEDVLIKEARYVLEKINRREGPADNILCTIRRSAAEFSKEKIVLLFEKSANKAKEILCKDINTDALLDDLISAQNEAFKAELHKSKLFKEENTNSTNDISSSNP